MKSRRSFPLWATLVCAAVILGLGGLLLWGVGLLLPDHTGETHRYEPENRNILLVPDAEADPVLYPWGELTEKSGSETDEEFRDELEKLQGFAGDSLMYFVQNSVLTGASGGKVMENADGTVVGIRDVIVEALVWEYDDGAEKIEDDPYSGTNALFRVSLAVSGAGKGESSLCCLEIRPASEPKRDGVEKADYEALCAFASEEKMDPETNPFCFFAESYRNFGSNYGMNQSGYASIVPNLIFLGEYTTFQYEGMVYFCYSVEGFNLTLICDPVERKVVGFSAEQY